MTCTDWRHTTTARLWLDLPTEADVDDLHAIHSDPESWRHFPSGRHTSRAQAAEMVTQAQWQFAPLQEKSVVRHEDSRHVRMTRKHPEDVELQRVSRMTRAGTRHLIGRYAE